MQGVVLTEVEIQDFWSHLRKVGGIASEILPAEPPKVAPHLALQQEFEFAHVLYQISRLVPILENKSPQSVITNENKYKKHLLYFYLCLVNLSLLLFVK